MTIFMNDGSEYQTDIEDASGSNTSPLTRDQLTAKAFTCCHKYDKLWVEKLIHDILKLEELSVLPSLEMRPKE